MKIESNLRITYLLTLQIIELAAEVDLKAKESDRVFGEDGPTSSWFRRFKKRHGFSVRASENKSVVRYNAEGDDIRLDLYEKYQEIITTNNIGPLQIFNMDETGFQLVTKGQRIVTHIGDRNVYVRVSGERSETISAAVCGNAAGSIILPPFFIFKGESLPAHLRGATYPPMSLFACSESGYMNSALFQAWFRMLIDHLPSIRPILLLLDGHKSHGSLEVLEMARKNNIIILCFPPHTTHKYQPCDVGVFASVKSYFPLFAAKRMRRKKTKAMARGDFGKVVSATWEKSVTPRNFRSGFKESGLWPIDEEQIMKLRESQAESFDNSDNSIDMNTSAVNMHTSTPLQSSSSTPGTSRSDPTPATTPSSHPHVTEVIRETLQPSPKKNDEV